MRLYDVISEGELVIQLDDGRKQTLNLRIHLAIISQEHYAYERFLDSTIQILKTIVKIHMMLGNISFTILRCYFLNQFKTAKALEHSSGKMFTMSGGPFAPPVMISALDFI